MPLPRPAMRSALLLAALLLAPAASGQIGLSSGTPTRGEPLTLTFDAPQDTVLVIYRPGSVTADTSLLRAGGDVLTFAPDRAGVVRIQAGEASQALSVRYPSPPLGGLFVMIAAGVILFGGAAASMRALFASDAPPEVPRRADT